MSGTAGNSKRRLTGDELEEKYKKQRLEREPSLGWSETSQPSSEDVIDIEHDPPPSSIKPDRVLTIPMDKRRQGPRPPCRGPKLAPFSDGDVHVKFVRLLDEATAVHSNVFEVTIDGKTYALKLFKTAHKMWFPEPDCWPKGEYPGSKEMAYYFRPFYNECRAYGRIAERNISHRYLRAYGYLRIPPYLRDELCDITGLPDHFWQVRPPEWDGSYNGSTTMPAELSWPIYGIVKEMAPLPCKWIEPRRRNVRTMLADLRQLHKAGILNNDLREDNYLAGRMFDFSKALTLPHIWYERRSSTKSGLWPSNFKGAMETEITILQRTIIEDGPKTTALQDQPEGCPSSRTRSMRALLATQPWSLSRPLSPFYELGVEEPPPPETE